MAFTKTEPSHEVIDQLIDFFNLNDMNYIAKNNKIYVHESDTNSILGLRWISYTPTELRRVLSAIHNITATPEEMVIAFQEADRAYERTAESDHEVRAGVFNTSYNLPITQQELVINEVLKHLSVMRNPAFVYMEVRRIVSAVFDILNIEEPSRQYINWSFRRFARYYKFRFREYGNRPFLPILEGENYLPKYYEKTGIKVNQKTCLQRLDTRIKISGTHNCYHFKAEKAAKDSETIALRVKPLLASNLPSVLHQTQRAKLQVAERCYEAQKPERKETDIQGRRVTHLN